MSSHLFSTLLQELTLNVCSESWFVVAGSLHYLSEVLMAGEAVKQ